jgi:cytochrome c biogenesis protein CcmG, thiol:disulfide interchange protein DsbE
MALGLKRVAQGLALALVLGLLALLAWRVIEDRDAGAAAHLRKGESPMAPNIDEPRLDRPGRFRLSDYRGKAVVVNLWASWCLPCKKEAPRLNAAWRRWRDRGVVVVGVDAQDLASDAKSFLREHRVPYPVVHDASGNVLDAYGWTYFPETYFVRPDGRLASAVFGEIDRDQLDEGIRGALAP